MSLSLIPEGFYSINVMMEVHYHSIFVDI
jgi:hypothetical protein